MRADLIQHLFFPLHALLEWQHEIHRSLPLILPLGLLLIFVVPHPIQNFEGDVLDYGHSLFLGNLVEVVGQIILTFLLILIQFNIAVPLL